MCNLLVFSLVPPTTSSVFKTSTLSLERGCSTSCFISVLGTWRGAFTTKARAFPNSFLHSNCRVRVGWTHFSSLPACYYWKYPHSTPWLHFWIYFEIRGSHVTVPVLQKRKLRPKVTFPGSSSKREAELGQEPRLLMLGPRPSRVHANWSKSLSLSCCYVTSSKTPSHHSPKHPANKPWFSELPLLNSHFSHRCNVHVELALKWVSHIHSYPSQAPWWNWGWGTPPVDNVCTAGEESCWLGRLVWVRDAYLGRLIQQLTCLLLPLTPGWNHARGGDHIFCRVSCAQILSLVMEMILTWSLSPPTLGKSKPLLPNYNSRFPIW